MIFALIFLSCNYSERCLISAKHLIFSQHRVRGEVKFHAKEFPAALEDLNKALELDPEDILALRYLLSQHPALHLDYAVLIGITDICLAISGNPGRKASASAMFLYTRHRRRAFLIETD